MESEDEEVIFENAALHQALTEMGVENISTEPVVSKELPCSDSPDLSNEKTNHEMVEDSARTPHRIETNFLTRLFLSEDDFDSIYKNFQRRTVDRLSSSSLLLHDDRQFLQSFKEFGTNSPMETKQNTICRYLWLFIKLFGMLTVILGMCLQALLWLHLVMDSTFVPDWIQEMDTCTFCVCLLCPALGFTIAYGLVKGLLCYKVYCQLKEMDCVIQDFEESAGKLSSIERKCIRRIRESELVARGFTLTSMSNTNSGNPLLSQIDKWCPSFRAALFEGNVEVIAQLEKSYQLLTESIPLIVDFKWVDLKPVHSVVNHQTSSSLSSSSSSGHKKETLSNCDGDCLQGPEDSLIHTSQLVSSQEILNIQISSFVRRLVLSFFMENCKDTSVNAYSNVSKSVQSCEDCIDSVTSLLAKHHSFYRAIHTSVDRSDTSDGQTKSKKPKSALESFYVVINSLDLHLQTVFHLTRELTLYLEGLVDEEKQQDGSIHNNPSGMSRIIRDQERIEWTDTLKGIKGELDSCKNCYDEAAKVLTHKASSPSNSPLPTLPSSTVKTGDSNTKPITVIPDSDPIIEDQVFEAVIDSDEGEEAETSHRPTYTAEERSQLRQQREDMSRFKQELKAVVDHRAIGQRKREAKALARTQGNESTSTAMSTTPPETDGSIGSVGDGEGDDEGEGGVSSVSPPTTLLQQKIKLCEKTPKENCNGLNLLLFSSAQTQPLCKKELEGVVVVSSCESGGDNKSDLNLDSDLKSGSKLCNNYNNGEKVSLLASKLDSADADSESSSVNNPSASHKKPWLPLVRAAEVKGNTTTSTTTATVQSGGARSKKKKGSSEPHSPSLSQQLPYDENWRSSIEKTKARHWEMCEKIIQENKDAGDCNNDDDGVSGSNCRCHKSSESNSDLAAANRVSADLDSSSFVDISSDDLLFYPLDTADTNNCDNNGRNVNGSTNTNNILEGPSCDSRLRQQEQQRLRESSDKATSSTSTSSNSQVLCPKSVDPNNEGFRDVDGAYVSRHNFTASGKGSNFILDKALNQLRNENRSRRNNYDDGDDDDDDEEEPVVHTNRKRHQAEKQDGKWVNISHVEFVSANGNQYELLRQKDVTAEDIAARLPIPSPDPCSSLNSSLALMAAARSRHFNLGVEEQFGDKNDVNDDDDDDGDAAVIEDEFRQAICAARLTENENIKREIPSGGGQSSEVV